jgi:hypothetical protein
MISLRKWWKAGLVAALFLICLQVAATLIARTHRVHAYLTAHLSQAFGRPVEVRSFDARILPSPQLFADGVTVGEDPAFGYEYFLRAERLGAGLRWTGLLRGHFEFGTLSLSKPSLILVRNSEGRWNLERWLPPAKTSPSSNARGYGPPAPAPPVNHLERIEFDEGRISFKMEEEKLPFAFTGVSGSVDQIAPGRWQLQLEAQPWRSGVLLQSAGTIRVFGDVAGTSARLQPAEISLQWTQASLADVLRLFRGQDYGVRGVFAMEANARSSSKDGAPGEWVYSAQARARQIHRWDLTERQDNPALNGHIKGRWNIGTGSLVAEEIGFEGPRSNLRGMFRYARTASPAGELRVDSAGIQASDLLAWYRAFHPDVAEGISTEAYFTGGMIVRGWPLTLESAAVSSSGGIARIPVLTQPIRIGPFSGGRQRSNLVIGPVRIALGETVRKVDTTKKRGATQPIENAVELTLSHDLNAHSGGLSIEGNVTQVENFLKLTAAFGRPLNRGWEVTGPASTSTRWEWKEPFKGQWSGNVHFSKATLTVAGLNQPLSISEGSLEWNEGRHIAHLQGVEGFGGTWSGSIKEMPAPATGPGARWKFDLSVDQLNAAELDRWIGPRARPTWVQRLLRSVLGEVTPATPASELVRRVNAEGELSITHLTVEKLKLDNVVAKGSLHDLKLNVKEAAGDWAGGKVRAKIDASFSPRPSYDISASLDRINLAQLPGAGRMAERVGGTASGNLELKTNGVGRDELLQNLDGTGLVQLKKVELRGWDVPASVAEGAARSGNSRWPSGECAFLVRDRGLVVQWLHLNDGKQRTSVQGKLSFASDADLSISTEPLEKSPRKSQESDTKGRVLKVSGPLDGPRVTAEKSVAPRVVN